MANNPKARANLIPCKKGQTANPNGRPKKGIVFVNAQLAKEGYEPAKKADIEANYMAMIQLSQDKLTTIANDKQQPMMVRILARSILGVHGFDIIEKMLDRGIGKAKTTEDISVSIEKVQISKEEKEKIDTILGVNFEK